MSNFWGAVQNTVFFFDKTNTIGTACGSKKLINTANFWVCGIIFFKHLFFCMRCVIITTKDSNLIAFHKFKSTKV